MDKGCVLTDGGAQCQVNKNQGYPNGLGGGRAIYVNCVRTLHQGRWEFVKNSSHVNDVALGGSYKYMYSPKNPQPTDKKEPPSPYIYIYIPFSRHAPSRLTSEKAAPVRRNSVLPRPCVCARAPQEHAGRIYVLT